MIELADLPFRVNTRYRGVMEKTDERDSFRIIDIVVLVAATALGLAAIRAYAQVPTEWVLYTPYSTMLTVSPSLVCLLRSGSFLSGAAAALLMAWSPVVLWCAWRSGRRRVKMIFERPGLLACAVAACLAPWVVFVPMRIEIAKPHGTELRLPELPPGLYVGHFLGFMKSKVGACVIIAWVILAVSRKWRQPVGAVEWAGVAVGIGWIATWLSYLAFS